MKMEQLINNLANTFKDEELIKCYDLRKKAIDIQDKNIKILEKLIEDKDKHIEADDRIIKSLQDRLKERNDYIHNLKWEHSNQLDKLKEKNKKYHTYMIDEVLPGCRLDCRNFLAFPEHIHTEELIKNINKHIGRDILI